MKDVKKTDAISDHPLKRLLLQGDTQALSKAISLVESQLESHSKEAALLISQLLATKKETTNECVRVAISGVPGVGKSTFIEALGMFLTNKGVKVAVLTVDPSSQQSGGSILGDKTRMEELSQSPLAFIRTTPAASHLGGVANNTRASIQLCEFAGFEVILIETVGVGQSELEAKQMVDFFLLLQLPGAGDEIQGIKRGIMEVADALLVNKADGAAAPLAKKTKQYLEAALHAFPSRDNGWEPPVILAAATERVGIAETWRSIEQYIALQKETGDFERQRKEQQLQGWYTSLYTAIQQSFIKDQDIKALCSELEEKILSGEISTHQASEKAIDAFRNK